FGGPGFVNFEADGKQCLTPAAACPVLGTKLGANFGVGMHNYINDFTSVTLEVRDIVVRNNNAGRDTTGDRLVKDDDLSLHATYFFSVNLTFFLPFKAVKSP